MTEPVVPGEGEVARAPLGDGARDTADATERSGEPNRPKRRGKVRTKHTVLRVLVASMLVLTVVTGLGVVYLMRHFSGNLTVIDTDSLIPSDERPEKIADAQEPQEPLNILVMGSDTRDCDGCALDNETGGNASDTTILMHLSADRERAYGISIPRDSIVDRPSCRTPSGETTAAATDVMWNEAFSVGGPTCTVRQFEATTGVFVDHIVVVNFAGFEDMVNAIGGVPVCIPEDIVDPAHGINIPAGTREIQGREALNYVRARYTLGNGSDIGRIKRQQAFVAAMAKKVISAGTLARPDRLLSFLDAATQSLTVDEGLDNLAKIANTAAGFQGIGLDNIKFLTVPNAYYSSDSDFYGRVYWKESASRLWEQVANDEPLDREFVGDSISAGKLPGEGGKPRTPEQIAAAQQRVEEDGLCA